MRVAIYGKGGIGKSTISSNLSAYIAGTGKTVLQIGCDPKHDSTLLLTREAIPTVLDMLPQKGKITEEDIVHDGIYGVKCVEIGGPKPGVGCAGRGIISGMEILEQIQVTNNQRFDYVIYDILGDVVCGGFFEPLRKKKVDRFYIVTSGEFNSLFAANNLCKGYLNCGLQNSSVVFGGIIGNLRGGNNEEQIIEKYCQLIGVPFVCAIPRDARIEKSMYLGEPLINSKDNEDLVKLYDKIYLAFNTPVDNTAMSTLGLDELRIMYKSYYNNC